MTPANPENVPLDKIPAGWRLLYEEEYKKPIPIRVWYNSGYFSKDMMLGAFCRKYTYITPDLPDNGQPWHAHKPGDPAPVAIGADIDIVLKNGEVIEKPTAPQWIRHEEFEILFYRLHEPAPMKTESNPPSPTTDRILSILIAAGHITEEQVEQARKLVKP